MTGGKKFSRDLQPIDKEGNPVGLWRVRLPTMKIQIQIQIQIQINLNLP